MTGKTPTLATYCKLLGLFASYKRSVERFIASLTFLYKVHHGRIRHQS